MGKITCYNFRGTAIDDYSICSASLLNSVLTFEVGDYCPLLSDHCPITLTLHSFIVTQADIQLQAFNRPKWSRDIEEKFVNSLETANFINVNNLLSQVSPQDNSIDNTDKLNNAITSFTDNLLLLASKNNRKSKRTIPKRKNKPWFNNECQSKLRLIRKLCRDLTLNRLGYFGGWKDWGGGGGGPGGMMAPLRSQPWIARSPRKLAQW